MPSSDQMQQMEFGAGAAITFCGSISSYLRVGTIVVRLNHLQVEARPLWIQTNRNILVHVDKKSGGEDGGFYSFLDELMWCRCGKGYCRNLFKNKNKYWCCPLKDTNDFGFRALVSQPSTGSPPATPVHPSTVTSPTTPKHPAPSHSSTGASPTPTTPFHFDSSTPTRLEEDLSATLAASQKANETLIGIVKDLVKKVSLKDEGRGSQHGTLK